jgi:hypothetical protein
LAVMRNGMLMRVRGNLDVHYCWVPQDPRTTSPHTSLCGVDVSEFRLTKLAVNCPDCMDKLDRVIDERLANTAAREAAVV